MMTLCELANKLGINSYPAKLEEIYKTVDKSEFNPCDIFYIKGLQAKYKLLGDYTEDVIKGARELAEKPELLLWAKLMCEYNKDATSFEARQLSFPVSDGTPAMDMMPILVLLCEVPEMIKKYEARGFSKEQIVKFLDNFRINLWVCMLLSGRPMLDKGHYNWLCHYTKAMIFDHKAFNFQPTTWGMEAIYLKNKASGKILPMMLSGKFHRNGLVLGSAGAEDEEGSFDAEFNAGPDFFKGHIVKGGRVCSEISMLKKSEWECVLSPLDNVIGLHIPRNANLDPSYVIESLKEGFELTRKHYPELNPKFIVCSSWLLEPKLAEILGEGAKVTFFTELFTKYPKLDYGKSCLGYVFTGYQAGPVENFPEDTRLQRGIKKLMLEGDYIRGTGGVIIDIT
jgi:hypothetical protein